MRWASRDKCRGYRLLSLAHPIRPLHPTLDRNRAVDGDALVAIIRDRQALLLGNKHALSVGAVAQIACRSRSGRQIDASLGGAEREVRALVIGDGMGW